MSRKTVEILKGVAGLVIMGVGWWILPHGPSLLVQWFGQFLVIVGLGLWYRRKSKW